MKESHTLEGLINFDKSFPVSDAMTSLSYNNADIVFLCEMYFKRVRIHFLDTHISSKKKRKRNKGAIVHEGVILHTRKGEKYIRLKKKKSQKVNMSYSRICKTMFFSLHYYYIFGVSFHIRRDHALTAS